MNPVLITTAKELTSYLRQLSTEGHPAMFCRAVGYKKLLVYDAPAIEDLYVDYFGERWSGRLYPLDLPTARDASPWWRKLWEGEIVEFFTGTSLTAEFVVAAKVAIWESLSDFHSALKKEDFRRVDHETVETLIGKDDAREMIFELSQGLGISVRRLRASSLP